MEIDPEKEELLFVNGLNASSGTYDFEPMSADQLLRAIRGERTPSNLPDLIKRHNEKIKDHFDVKYNVDRARLEEAGWGIVFAPETSREIKEALRPLIEHRRKQAGEKLYIYEGYYQLKDLDDQRRFIGSHNQCLDRKSRFLSANNAAAYGVVDPNKMPYYLLLVGSPETITYQFQYQLDVQYAVGRIHFETVEEYGSYVEHLIKAETESLPPRAAFFGANNTDDRTTELSTKYLLKPLLEGLRGDKKLKDTWWLEEYLGSDATKGKLKELLSSGKPPAFLMTATHGLAFNANDPQQEKEQGALVCQDWPGPKQWKTEIPRSFYFSGDDLDPQQSLQGMIAFIYACYGAGIPERDQFAQRTGTTDRPAVIARRPFIAPLARKMLANGAVAVIGHIERAWNYSYSWPGESAHDLTFQSIVHSILDGNRVGAALEHLIDKYAEYSTELNQIIEQSKIPGQADSHEIRLGLLKLWTANNDARGYIILGDPAARLNLASPPQTSFAVDPKEPDKVVTSKDEVIPSKDEVVTPKADSRTRDRPKNKDSHITPLPLPKQTNEKPHTPKSRRRINPDRLRPETKKPGQTEHVIYAPFDPKLKGPHSTHTYQGEEQMEQNQANNEVDAGEDLVEKLLAIIDEELDVATSSENGVLARTKITTNGRVVNFLPLKVNNSIDHEIWNAHREIMDKALDYRTERLEVLMDALTILTGFEEVEFEEAELKNEIWDGAKSAPLTGNSPSNQLDDDASSAPLTGNSPSNQLDDGASSAPLTGNSPSNQVTGSTK